MTMAALAAPPARAADPAPPLAAPGDEQRADDFYDQGRSAIEDGRYDRAVERFDRVIALKTTRTDAALYWKAYSLAKLGQRTDALTTLTDLQKQFGQSRWVKDARALEVEIRQASGQPVAPESQNDEELKLLALRGLMQSDPDKAMPIVEKLLTGANTSTVKDRALFVLSQSSSPRARDVIVGVAKGTANPDLQLRAIKYLGIMGGNENRQILADVYRASADVAVKRAILRGYMTAGDRDRLLALAKSETSPELRGEAVQQLGVMNADAELSQLYSTESSTEVKKRILQALFVSGGVEKLTEVARTEKDAELRRTAIRNLGLTRRAGASETLTAIYAADSSPDIRKAVVNALFLEGSAKALVDLARAEKNVEMKKEIVSKLSLMPKSKEASDYLMELLR